MTYREQRCATHPDRDGAVACARCGSFACPECERAGLRGPLCASCHARMQTIVERSLRVRRVGSTFLLVGVLAALNAVILGWNGIESGTALVVVIALACAAVAALGLKTGASIQRLAPVGRRLGLVFASALLLVFPLGTLLGAEALYVLARNPDCFGPAAHEALASVAPRASDGISGTQRVIIALLLLGVAGFLLWTLVIAPG